MRNVDTRMERSAGRLYLGARAVRLSPAGGAVADVNARRNPEPARVHNGVRECGEGRDLVGVDGDAQSPASWTIGEHGTVPSLSSSFAAGTGDGRDLRPLT